MARLNWGMIGGGEGSQIGPAHRLGAGLDGLFGFSCAQRSPPLSPKTCSVSPCWRPTAIDEVQSRPTVPPDMRKFTIASSSSCRVGMQEVMSADSLSTSCPVT